MNGFLKALCVEPEDDSITVLSIPLNGFLVSYAKLSDVEVIKLPFNSIEWILEQVLAPVMLRAYFPLSIPLNGFSVFYNVEYINEKGRDFQFH